MNCVDWQGKVHAMLREAERVVQIGGRYDTACDSTICNIIFTTTAPCSLLGICKPCMSANKHVRCEMFCSNTSLVMSGTMQVFVHLAQWSRRQNAYLGARASIMAIAAACDVAQE